MPEKLFSLKKVLLGVLLGLVIVGGWHFYPQIQKSFQTTFQRVNQTTEQEIQPASVKPPAEPAMQLFTETVAKTEIDTGPSGNADPSPKESTELSATAKPEALAPVYREADSGTGGADMQPYFFRYFENRNLAQAYIKRWQEATGQEFVLKQEGDLFMIYFLTAEDQRKDVEAKIEAATGLRPVKRPEY